MFGRTLRWLCLPALGIATAATLSPGPLPAQEPAVRAYLEAAEVEVGEPFRLIVEVSGVSEVEDVFVPPVFQFTSHRHDGLLPFTTEITTPDAEEPGGVVVFTYTFLATGAGSIKVGPVLVKADGRDLETERVTLLVKDPENVTVRARIEPAEVRVMEEFEIHVEIVGVESLVERPILPDVSEFAIRGGGSSRGAAEASFGFVALQPGTHEVDPVSVKVGNRTYDSEPLTVVVTDEPPPVEVFAALNTGQTWVGSDFVLAVMVEGVSELEEAPVLPDMSGFAEVVHDDGGGFRGGNQVASRYRFRALTPGEFEVGPVRIKIDGRTMQTEPIRLTIGETPAEPPVSPNDLRATTEADARRVHVGEPVIVSYGLLSRQSPLYGAGAWYVQYDTLTMPVQEDVHVQQLPGHGYWEEGRVSVDGRSYQPYAVARVAVVPRKPGETTIRPADIKLQIHRRGPHALSGPPDLTANPAEMNARVQGIWTPMTLTSEAVPIEVIPLPSAGRPVSFSGHVGRLDLVSWVNRTDLVVGDTATLQVELSGDGHSHLMPDPEIAFPAGLEVIESDITQSNPIERDGSLRGTRSYTYRLVANRVGRYRIPVVEVSYFDAESESYGAARSGPFDLAVVSSGKE